MSCPVVPGLTVGKNLTTIIRKKQTAHFLDVDCDRFDYNQSGGSLVETKKFPPFVPIFISGILMGALGWAGLAYVILFNDPDLGYRWLFFFFVMLAVGGTSLPVVAFLNRRFPSEPVAGEGVILRQAVWIGLYCSLMVWLQQGRILTNALAFFLAGGFVLVEVILRMGEKARWHPPRETDHE
jgi:hypothetical protein